MSIKQFFQLPKEFRKLQMDSDGFREITNIKLSQQQQRIDGLEQKLSLLQGKLEVVEKFFSGKPIKNDIEETAPEEIDITDDFRVPMVDGMKIKFEGEKEEIPIKIYGSGQNPKKTN